MMKWAANCSSKIGLITCKELGTDLEIKLLHGAVGRHTLY